MFFNKWLFLLSSFSFSNSSKKVPFFMDYETCNTDTCFREASNILKTINTTIEPCEDFYEFSCGLWNGNNPRPSHEAFWSPWEQVLHKVDHNLQDILLKRYPENYENLGIKLAQKMLHSCLLIDEQKNVKETLSLIKTLIPGGFFGPQGRQGPNLDFFDFDTVAKINRDFQIYPLLKFHVSPNLYNTTDYILYIDYPSLSFPKEMLINAHVYSPQIKSYKTLITETIEYICFLENIKINNLHLQIDEIINFEKSLAGIIHENEGDKNISNLYKKITIEQLQIWTNLISQKKINWNDLLSNFQKITPTSNIIVKDLLFVLNLVKFLEKTQPKTINNYLTWITLNYFLKEISPKFDEIFFKFENKLFGTTKIIPRKKKCFSSIKKFMNIAVSREYIKLYVPEILKKNVRLMIDEIKNILLKKLKGYNWLDEKTKNYAFEKTKYISYIIAYPDYYLNISFINYFYKNLEIIETNNILNIISWNKFIRKNEFNKLNLLNSVTDVNAYYNILKNLIIIPSGIIQHPFYEKNRLNALNYGAIGTLIGHELSHAFDETGRQADKHGNIRQWWTENSLKTYKKNVKCLSDHYNTIKLQLFPQLIPQISHDNNQDENIADIIGLSLAFEAFKQNKQFMKLPGLEYTEEQLFFISFAQQWCENTTPENLLLQLVDGVHTPNKLRVLGALANSQEFGKHFHCPVNKKCDF